mgnify:CR=1 FL=1
MVMGVQIGRAGETESDPGVCARCAALGPTCCHLDPVDSEFCFPLSEMEKNRILDCSPISGGFVLQSNSNAFVDNVCRLFPGEDESVRAVFAESDSHFRLAVNEDGECRFLGSEGCTIPRECRPYYCRLFPFWVVGGEVIHFDAQICLARREGDSLPQILNSIGTNRAEIRDLYGRLRLAWGLSPARGMCRVKKGF